MGKQPDLFNDTAPFQPHSLPSIAAAMAIEPTLGRLQQCVLAHLRECGKLGATDDEMQVSLRLNPSTQRPRRIELCEKSLVMDSGRTRPTRSGKQAAVWVVKS